MPSSLLTSEIRRKYPSKSDGYVRVLLASGEMTEEHRVVMARALGRELEPGEIIRHLDGDNSNNTLSNLMLDRRGAAGSGHAMVTLVCTGCSTIFERRASQVDWSRSRGKTHFYCGHRCSGKKFGRAKGSAMATRPMEGDED